MRQTDNTGTTKVPVCAYPVYPVLDSYWFISQDRYEEFLWMIHEWRNLKMLKRAGWGHDTLWAMGTKECEFTVLCPACPQDGKNLPSGWRDAPEEIQYVLWLQCFIKWLTDSGGCLRNSMRMTLISVWFIRRFLVRPPIPPSVMGGPFSARCLSTVLISPQLESNLSR